MNITKKQLEHLFIGTLLAGTALGCAVTQPLSTASGKPEINITTTDNNKIKSVLIDHCLTDGFHIVDNTDYSIVLSKQWDNFDGAVYQAAVGGSGAGTPDIVLNISLVPVNSETRVMIHPYISMQNAFGRTDTHDWTNPKILLQLQTFLEKVKYEIEQ